MSARSPLIRALPCLACQIFGIGSYQCGPTEEHHLNLGGKAGQKRRGDDYSVPLGAWHHRGEPPADMTAKQALAVYGPSLARHSRRFREVFGSDDSLLARTDRMLLP